MGDEEEMLVPRGGVRVASPPAAPGHGRLPEDRPGHWRRPYRGVGAVWWSRGESDFGGVQQSKGLQIGIEVVPPGALTV